MVATSATRDAANAADFVHGVRGVLGLEPEVLSGEEEAYLSFVGATAEFGAGPASRGGRAVPGGGHRRRVHRVRARRRPRPRGQAGRPRADRAPADLITGPAGPPESARCRWTSAVSG